MGLSLKRDQDAIETLRQTNTGRLLMRALRAFNERAMAAVRARGHGDLSLAHAAVLPHIGIEGTRLTEIADAAEMRKQSAAQLVGELEAAGYVTRQADPGDRRAQLVRFTERGREFLQDAAAVKAGIEAEIESALGAEDYGALRRLLGRFPGAERET